MEPSASQQSLGVEGLLRVLRRRLGLIIGYTVLIAGSAFAFSLTQPTEYTSSASLLFRDPALDRTLFGSSFLDPTPDANRAAATNVALVSLDTVAQRAASKLPDRPTATAVSESVEVTPEGQSDVVKVNATDRSPERAALLANTFAEEFIAFRREADRSKVKEAQRLVNAQLASVAPEDRKTDTARSLEARAEQLNILASLQTGNAELVQAARAPDDPSSPQTKRNVAIGGVLGLLLGLGAALLLDRLDRRIKDPEELEELYGLPILGLVPESRGLRPRGIDPVPNADAEAFRMLRARLRYFNVDRDLRSLLVTSSASEDGKTTVAWNLARIAAMSGHGSRVILVETDMRRPSIALSYGLRPVPGLAELLTQGFSLDEVIQQVPTTLGHNGSSVTTNLDVLVAGGIPPNPSELIESAKMRELLEYLQAEYDFVVVDTAPTSVVSDGIPLMSQVSGVLVVSRLGRTTRDAAMALRRQLDGVNAPALGVIGNRVKSAPGSYGTYGGYEPHPEQDRPMAKREPVELVEPREPDPEPVAVANGDAGDGEPDKPARRRGLFR